MREIRSLRAMRRELETEPRRVLPGHEGGNPGHRQGRSSGATAPVLDPTGVGSSVRAGNRELPDICAREDTVRQYSAVVRRAWPDPALCFTSFASRPDILTIRGQTNRRGGVGETQGCHPSGLKTNG